MYLVVNQNLPITYRYRFFKGLLFTVNITESVKMLQDHLQKITIIISKARGNNHSSLWPVGDLKRDGNSLKTNL